MHKLSLLAAVLGALALASSARAADQYSGWSGQDCVDMGKNCLGLCDKYGVPETKASCMFNCTSKAMQCIDKVQGVVDRAPSRGLPDRRAPAATTTAPSTKLR